MAEAVERVAARRGAVCPWEVAEGSREGESPSETGSVAGGSEGGGHERTRKSAGGG